MKKEIFIVIFGIIISELVMLRGNIFYGLGLYIINLLIIIFLIILSRLEIKMKYALQSLVLLILLRMISISIPQFFANVLLQYSLIYGVMFIPIFSIIKGQNISAKELGINFKKLYIYIPLAVLMGIILGFIEYKIIDPASLIERIKFSDIVIMFIVMFIYVATAEEIIFRSILQTRLQKVLGIKYGILISGTIFGIMHAGYGIINDIIFAGILGIVLGYIFYRSESIPFVILIHGVANVTLFGLLPIYGELII